MPAHNVSMVLFPSAIQDFAEAFVRMQQFHHLADCGPLASFSRSTVQQWIEDAQDVSSRLHTVPPNDIRAFAVYIIP